MAVQPPLLRSITDLDDARRAFLAAEDRATAGLIGFYREARLELVQVLEGTEVLTLSEARYYGALRGEIERILVELDAGGTSTLQSSLSVAYGEAYGQHLAMDSVSLPLVNQRALKALSDESLGLITRVSDDVRFTIRQQIAQGIAQGLSGGELRRRLSLSGMTSGPWRDMETRAGVIARTETMRAYNAGALGAIVQTGAEAVRWITARDEAACQICKPRNGIVYRLPGATDHYAGGLELYPGVPAHPRCRCAIRAEYRRPDGSMIGGPELTPEPVPGPVAVAQEGLPAPVASGDMDQVLQMLRRPRGEWDEAFTERMVSMDLDDDALRRLANELLPADFSSLIEARHGIIWSWPETKSGYAWWTGKAGAQGRFEVLRALNRVQRMVPRYVQAAVDPMAGRSPAGLARMIYLRAMELGKTSRRNWLASCDARGQIILDASKLKPYVSKTLRSGSVSGFEESVLHEIGHSVHNRFGWGSNYGASFSGSVEGMLEADWREMIHAWEQILRDSRGVALSATEQARVEANLEVVAKNLRTIEDAQVGMQRGSARWLYYERQKAVQTRYQREQQALLSLDKGELEGLVDSYPTTYSKESTKEDFAETFMLYLVNPAHLKLVAPRRYEWMQRWVFGGKEA